PNQVMPCKSPSQAYTSNLKAGRIEAGSVHMFEKPVELGRYLLDRHCYEGELVVDLCGCSGALTVAAIQKGCRYLYIESEPTNYQFGAARIAQALQPEIAVPMAA